MTPRAQHLMQARAGFTLVETLLALSLSAFLLIGVYAAVDQSIRMTASGREEMERAQLARALIHRIEVDLRAVTFIPPPPTDETTEGTTTSTTTTSSSSSSSSSSGSTASTSTSSTSSTSTQMTADNAETETEPNSRSIGIRGTSQRIELSVARPRRDLLPGSSQSTGLVGTSDLRSVTYSFVATGLAPTASTGSGSLKSASANSGGLVRSEGDRMAVEAVEATGGASTTVGVSQTLAPEVSAVNFRYFDGRTWLNAWDSEANGRIPRAVEVMIMFAAPKKKPSLFNVAVNRSLDSFRTVIMIPISDPFPPEFLP